MAFRSSFVCEAPTKIPSNWKQKEATKGMTKFAKKIGIDNLKIFWMDDFEDIFSVARIYSSKIW